MKIGEGSTLVRRGKLQYTESELLYVDLLYPYHEIFSIDTNITLTYLIIRRYLPWHS